MDNVLRVSVEFMGPFELSFGATELDLTLPAPATIRTLLEALAARCDAARELYEALRDRSAPRQRYYYVSLDYQALPPDTLLDTPLHDDARVCFAMPMAGG